MSSIYGSAAGANVVYGKNNYGVAFAGAACAEEYYSLELESLVGRAIGVGREGAGFQPTSGNPIFEKTVTSVTFKLDNDSRDPDETVTCNCRNSSGAVVDTFGTKDATEITSATPSEFTFDTNQITLSSGDIITLEYPITSGDAIQTRVYLTATNNYVSNANTLVSTGADLTNWVTWQDGYSPYNYYWNWLKVIYCP